MKPYIVKQLFIACTNFKTDTCQPGTKGYLSNITREISKLQKLTGEHLQFKISLGEAQITNTHRGVRKSKPFSPGTDSAGLIFTGELSRVDSAGALGQERGMLLYVRSVGFCHSEIDKFLYLNLV